MAFTAVVAMATYGGAVATGVAVFTAMTYVGISLTVIGALTKDKQLLKTGSLLSAVGGVGNALTNASGAAGGLAGDAAADAAAEEASQAVIADTATESAGNIFAGAPEAASAAGSGTTAAAGSVAPMSSGSAGADAMLASDGLGSQVVPAAQSSSMPVVQTSNIDPAGMSQAASSGVQGASAPAGITDPAAAFDPLAESASVGVQTAGKVDSNSFFTGVGKVWDGLGSQGKASAIQMVGGALSGAAETERHNDMMDYRNRALDLRSHGSAVANYRKTGLINSAKA